jgi:type III secretion protein V
MRSSNLGSAAKGILSRSECLLGVVVMLAVTLLIIPVPPLMMDFLLSLNISLSVIMLLLALQVKDSLKIAAFPTMLLVATLFRLSLNVSTTRLILLQADAGEVVEAFGSFVVRGNPLVGGVVFLILTLVQFIVIAKGSERVAEVTARFTLDGMPGKQMSIDADLRAGSIDQEGASRKRSLLEREAQFHGAMDGAMKFVKGDAIAGIVITAINIIGGLLVGCMQRSMSAGDAVGTYSVLTIGDGLVSQIPALLISTAAGLVVTRVRSENSETTLGKQIIGQIKAHPQTLFISGGVLVMIGLVPGMPMISFGILGVILIAIGFVCQGQIFGQAMQPKTSREHLSPVILVLGSDFASQDELALHLDKAMVEIGDKLGVFVPSVFVRASDQKGRWTLYVDHMPLAAGSTKGKGSASLSAEIVQVLQKSVVRFIGVQETQNMLDELEKVQPALVNEVVPRLVPPVLLTEILARLVEEEVPVHNLRGILATLAEWSRTEADPAALAERVRVALSAAISFKLAPEGNLNAFLLDPAVEKMLQGAIQHTGSSTILSLSPEEGDSIVKGLEKVLEESKNSKPVVLCRPEYRRSFWKLISASHPQVRVVSFLELDPKTSIQPTGRVSLAAA